MGVVKAIVYSVNAPAFVERGVAETVVRLPAVIVTPFAEPVSIFVSSARRVYKVKSDVVWLTVGFFIPERTRLTALSASTAELSVRTRGLAADVTLAVMASPPAVPLSKAASVRL